MTTKNISGSMKNMKQRSLKINLNSFMTSPDGWGNAQGKEVGSRLEDYILKNPLTEIFQVSFKGINRTDASFSRECVVEIASRFRTKKGITIVDLDDIDLIENLELAAVKKTQPLFLWQGDSWRLLGPNPSKGNTDLLNYALSISEITTSAASSTLGLKLTNASTKLKQLWEGGYIMRREEMAPTGGIEFIYYRIK